MTTESKLSFEEITSGPIFSFETMKGEAKSWDEFLKNFTYRPGYEFRYDYDIDFNIHKIIARFTVEDTYNRGRMIPIVFQHTCPAWDEMGGETRALSYLRSVCHDLEMHESDEWFRYKGEMVFDPHAWERGE
jgi:hypothetical protein